MSLLDHSFSSDYYTRDAGVIDKIINQTVNQLRTSISSHIILSCSPSYQSQCHTFHSSSTNKLLQNP